MILLVMENLEGKCVCARLIIMLSRIDILPLRRVGEHASNYHTNTMISVAGQPIYNKQKLWDVLKFPLHYTQAEITPKPKLWTYIKFSLILCLAGAWISTKQAPARKSLSDRLITSYHYQFILDWAQLHCIVSPGRSASSAWGECWDGRVERKKSVKLNSLETRRTSWELRQSYFELDLHTKCCLPSLRTFQDNTDDKTRHPRFSTLWRFLFFLQQGHHMDPIDGA